ncbi:hypothetical protein [Pseudomonas sp. CFBP 8772]|uniref:hypothetical protein n=1 Tax=Pseudomonas sp. CFBP 8772 TaxID=2775284 RepID=UPI00177DF94E|nr:hypothetical protein [Pseudomonas sp. CFBP 8772]MBD8599448.1 hypothetical protein [Pseudomonas sp. CFBP 8772]
MHAPNVFITVDRLIIHLAMPLANVGVDLRHAGEALLFAQRQVLSISEVFKRQSGQRIIGDSQVCEQSRCL